MKRILIAITGFVCVLALMICGVSVLSGFSTASEKKGLSASGSGREVTTRDHDASSGWTFSEGTGEYRGFVLDNVLRSSTQGNIHFNLYVPDSYDGTKPYALFVTLPGYQGLHFQGVGINLRTEEFGFVAQDYNRNMIIAAPQLDDWGDTSAKQTIELTEYLLDVYNIDRNKVYGEGYSGGGETMSRVMGMRPELFSAYLQCASQFDGDIEVLAKARTPVRLVVGAHDEYYGAQPSRETYDRLHALYRDQGLTDIQIDRILVLDVRPDSYFSSQDISNQHGRGGHLFANDSDIMGWLFNR